MLEPGPETDLRVAEAIGVEGNGGIPIAVCDEDGRIQYVFFGFSESPYSRQFSPSTNLNDAFWAAENVDLWKGYVLHLYEQENVTPHQKGWAVSILAQRYLEDTISDEPTPALAICAAILSLKEKE